LEPGYLGPEVGIPSFLSGEVLLHAAKAQHLEEVHAEDQGHDHDTADYDQQRSAPDLLALSDLRGE
jgi:hypothetical protein